MLLARFTAEGHGDILEETIVRYERRLLDVLRTHRELMVSLH